MRQYEMAEFEFLASEPINSLVEVPLEAVFTNGDRQISVKGFYAGNNTYKVRICPDREGQWQYEIKGLISQKGSFLCEPAEKAHGLVHAQGTHFVYEDGSRYVPFGTTVYALWHQNKELMS